MNKLFTSQYNETKASTIYKAIISAYISHFAQKGHIKLFKQKL